MAADLPEMSLMETFFGPGVSPLMTLGLVAGSYVLGCFSTGYYLVRQRTGQDIRELGSGSTGARNAGRVLGRNGFLLTMAGDLAKGGLAVWLALGVDGQRPGGVAGVAGRGGGACLAGAIGFPRRQGGLDFVGGAVDLRLAAGADLYPCFCGGNWR